MRAALRDLLAARVALVAGDKDKKERSHFASTTVADSVLRSGALSLINCKYERCTCSLEGRLEQALTYLQVAVIVLPPTEVPLYNPTERPPSSTATTRLSLTSRLEAPTSSAHRAALGRWQRASSCPLRIWQFCSGGRARVTKQRIWGGRLRSGSAQSSCVVPMCGIL